MPSSFFSHKKILVTGGTGMLGMALVELLLKQKAQVRVASMDNAGSLPEGVEFFKLDLTRWDSCIEACRDMDYVFHLAGVKGGVGIGCSQAARFLEANTLVNLHMLKAAWECKAQKYLFVSSIGVYPDAEIFREDEVWDKPPHPSDRYGAWGKRIGELQCEAYLEQYGYKTCIVRPSTIYGAFDNFNPKTAMVIPALISRITSGEDPLVVWGDGSQIRDFIYSKDCARGMMRVMEKYYECDPVNLGSGKKVTIREVVETILKYVPRKPKVVWDTGKPVGNRIRLMDVTKARQKAGFETEYSLDQGIRETVDWYLTHQDYQVRKYNAFV